MKATLFSQDLCARFSSSGSDLVRLCQATAPNVIHRVFAAALSMGATLFVVGCDAVFTARGRVVGPDGVGIAGATVSVAPKESSDVDRESVTYRTRDNGEFNVQFAYSPQAKQRSFDLRIEKDGFATHQEVVGPIAQNYLIILQPLAAHNEEQADEIDDLVK